MTFSDLYPTSADELRLVLLGARDDVADAATIARGSLGVAWESEAADRFREEVRALLGEIDADVRAVEDAAAVLGP